MPPAEAELAAVPEAVAVKLTWMLRICPTASGPTLAQLKVPVPVELGVMLAPSKCSLAPSKLSETETVGSAEVPVLATWML